MPPAKRGLLANRPLLALVAVVAVLGLGVTQQAVGELWRVPPGGFAIVLALGTIVVGRFRLQVPGHPASVSVSEVFVFASAMLYGPGPVTVTLAVDGFFTALLQRNRRVDRVLFNTAEPALSVWVAAWTFFALSGVPPLALAPVDTTTLLLPTAAMVATFFAFNSVLTAAAVAMEQRVSAWAIWRQHALYLALNYAAGASLAALGVNNSTHFNPQVIGLVAPVLVLSYVAYRASSQRLADAERHVREVDERYLATIESLAMAVDEKDDVTHGHVRRVQRWAGALAQAVGMTDAEQLKALEAAALLHDVGKVTVADEVLNKPGRLSPREFEIMKRHVLSGVRILERVRFPYPVVPIVRHHHEMWNGKGYPDGLAGEAIPFGARILTVVDCFDALTSDRPYRRRLSDAQALTMIEAGRSVQFDPQVIDQFVALVPELRRMETAASGARVADSDERLSRTADPALVDREAWVTLRRNAPGVIGALNSMMPTADVAVFGADLDAGRVTVIQMSHALACACARAAAGQRYALSTWVATHRLPIPSSDAALDLGPLAAALTLNGAAAMPVFDGGALVGVLTLYRPDTTPLTESQMRVLATAVTQLTRRDASHDGEPSASAPGPLYDHAMAVSTLSAPTRLI